jgi:hypothetical protein
VQDAFARVVFQRLAIVRAGLRRLSPLTLRLFARFLRYRL